MNRKKMVYGMVGLHALPGSFLHKGESMESIIDHAMREAAELQKYGFDGFLLQNMADGPVKQEADLTSTAGMAAVAAVLRREFKDMRLGILLNWDGVGSLAAAAASGADFVRVEHVYTRAEMTAAGIIEGQCVKVCEMKKKLGLDIPVYADVYEPHSVQMYPAGLETAAFDTVFYGHADGIFLCGKNAEESLTYADRVRKVVRDTPIILGGGSTGDNVFELMRRYDGVCVGAWIKGGDFTGDIRPELAKRYMDEVRRAEGSESEN